MFVGTEKMTTDVGPEVCFQLGREDALSFYTMPVVLVGRVNKGGLGWLWRRFEQVSWSTLELVLHLKPDMYQLWLSKQCIGICATRQNLARIQDILDNKSPNCGKAWEISTHLNRCPNNGHTLLFKESITNLSTWMHQQNCTDPELAYWIEKYLLFHGTRSFASLVNEGGFCSNDLCLAAAGQDLIGWTEFLHGKVLVEFASIQHIHCALSPSCRLTGDDWMKVFVSQLIQISHSQWIFHNYTLHDKQWGYLRLRANS